MKFRRLETREFGPLSGRTFELDANAFVVLGRNEAGKSTFHQVLETVLYGFQPGNRDLHPLAIHTGGRRELELLAEVETAAGAHLQVERLLQTAGTVRVAPAGEELSGPRDRSNAPLPQVQAVPRSLYRAVYSLTANGAIELGDDVRNHVDELLLGELGLPGTKATHELRAELGTASGALWRSDSRARTRASELDKKERELRKAHREARSQENELRAEAEELELRDAELRTLKEERHQLRAERDDAQFLAALSSWRRRADGVRSLRAEALNGRPMGDPLELTARIQEAEVRLISPTERLTRPALEVSEEASAVLLHEAQIEQTAAERGSHAHSEHIASDAEAGAVEAWNLAGESLSRLDLDAEPDTFAGVALEPLRAQADAWAEEIEDERAEVAAAGPERPTWPLFAAIGGTILVALGSFVILPPIWSAVGGAALLIAVIALLLPQPTRELVASEQPEEMESILAALSLDPRTVSTPAAALRLADNLERVADQVVQAQRNEALQAQHRRLAAETSARWEELNAACTLPCDLPAEALAGQLQTALERARGERRAVLEDSTEREAAQLARDAAQREVDRLQGQLAPMLECLRASFSEIEDVAEALEAWRKNADERVFVEQRERELQESPRWERLSGDERGDAEAHPDDPVAEQTRDERLRELDEEIETVTARGAELRRILEDDPGSRAARAREELGALQAERSGVLQERDRLELLGALVAESERAHRAEHQPDVLRRASEYLQRITSGRYSGLSYPTGDDGPLFVQPADNAEPIPVAAPLSRGIQEQIYVSLRLGTLDYLDQGREPLPLVMDEALVHWDSLRRAELYSLLREVSQTRQVVLFTCHPELAAEAETDLGARVVSLDGSEASAAEGVAPTAKKQPQGAPPEASLFDQ